MRCLLVLLLLSLSARAQGLDVERVRAVPPERTLADGRLRVVNLYRAQALALAEAGLVGPDSTVERLVRDAHRPYADFWAGYLGDEDAFREWSRDALLDPETSFADRVGAFLDADLDGAFEHGAAWVEATTGHAPEGTWVLAYGPGWTDMGGLGGIGMVADLSKLSVEPEWLPHLVAHELVHQVHGPALDRAGDLDRGTVLHRIVAEGLGTYAAYVHAAGTATPARAVGYTDAEWRWALAHEPHLAVVVSRVLDSTDRDYIDAVADRGARILDGAPGAAGYVLGFRIVQAYEAAHGPGSWVEMIDLPVREALRRSGYAYLHP
ncbi:DUF2268 domain-containing putative Zn-dependent protease [Rubrivirga marina]|uniref:DUF2268 domain-containing protein n=1 Tax=Rubrivirga marina TaxID=1196024 RepID=A0A271IXJ7_9BACT|nr:DUF2268 domain-containing putative Zn-dependent protease [Rubrivirga marina]PAP75981.1 hypothetical protein BSZ37_05760 [Rubrivirga marina]